MLGKTPNRVRCFVMGKERKTEEKAKRNFWRTLIPYMRDYRKNIVATIIFSLITGVCVAMQPFVISFIIDSGILGYDLVFLGFKILPGFENTDHRMTLVLILCGIYILFSLVRITCWAIGLSNMVKTLEGSLFNLRSKFFGHVQNMCMRFYDRNSSGELYNYIMGSPMGNIKAYLNSMIMSVPYQAVSLVISLNTVILSNRTMSVSRSRFP